MNNALLDKQFSRQKLCSTIDLIDKLSASKFPYDDSVDALQVIKVELDEVLREIEQVDSDANPNVIYHFCREGNSLIYFYMGFIGLLLRSSNVRNAFELYSSIKEIAERILRERDIKVVISSEWNFSPLIYPIPSKRLSRYIFVGLPASESQNALVIPLAGHELGHAIWRRSGLQTTYNKRIEARIISIFEKNWDSVEQIFRRGLKPKDVATHFAARAIWEQSLVYSKRQIEEVFCDLIGVWLFGTSYLHAFRYLAAPAIGDRRNELYPPMQARSEILVKAALEFSYPVPKGYIDSFNVSSSPSSTHPAAVLLLHLADQTTATFVDELIHEVNAYLSRIRAIHKPTREGIQHALTYLDLVCAVPGAKTIADITNAAWQIRLDLASWNIPDISDDGKIPILSDLVFKSLEVDEYNRLVESHARKQRDQKTTLRKGRSGKQD
jgi:hypothetical protein